MYKINIKIFSSTVCCLLELIRRFCTQTKGGTKRENFAVADLQKQKSAERERQWRRGPRSLEMHLEIMDE
jgi:hypothetical protein